MVLPRFREHFDRWLVNLTDVLSEFESNPNVSNEQFVTERSQILSNVEFDLKQRGLVRRLLLRKPFKSYRTANIFLDELRKNMLLRQARLWGEKEVKLGVCTEILTISRKELDNIARMKAGLLRGISKKDREQKETEAIQKLNAKQTELELAMLDLSEVKEKLQEEYERKKKPVTEQIKDSQKKVESLETDGVF